MISYHKLFKRLIRMHTAKSALLEVVTPYEFDRLCRDEHVSTAVIDRLCRFLNCQPSDIFEFVQDKE